MPKNEAKRMGKTDVARRGMTPSQRAQVNYKKQQAKLRAQTRRVTVTVNGYRPNSTYDSIFNGPNIDGVVENARPARTQGGPGSYTPGQSGVAQGPPSPATHRPQEPPVVYAGGGRSWVHGRPRPENYSSERAFKAALSTWNRQTQGRPRPEDYSSERAFKVALAEWRRRGGTI